MSHELVALYAAEFVGVAAVLTVIWKWIKAAYKTAHKVEDIFDQVEKISEVVDEQLIVGNGGSTVIDKVSAIHLRLNENAKALEQVIERLGEVEGDLYDLNDEIDGTPI